MARSMTPATQTKLEGRILVPRDFLWIVARDRTTGDPVPDGVWSGITAINADVVDPDTGTNTTRAFYGAGGLVSISDIPAVSNLAAQNVTIVMSQIDDHIADLVRDYDVKQAKVEIFRGLLDPSTGQLDEAAACRFVGFVDDLDIKTPKENDAGSVTLTCIGYSQELQRSNPDTRSDASQKLRSATDDFFVDSPVVGDWVHNWGQTSDTIATAPSQAKQGLLGWGDFLGFL